MIPNTAADQGLQTASEVPAGTLQNPSCQDAVSSVHGDRDTAGHSRRTPSTHLGAGSGPSGKRGDAASGTADPDLRQWSPRDDPERTRRAVIPEKSVPVKSMLDFGEGRMGLQVRQIGLSFPDEMPFDSWRELGSRVALVANCSAWWLGDWLLYGEQAYGDRYEQAIADTSLGYQTLRNYAWVARKFPMSRRRDTLSFGHHAEVAALLDDEQDAWLARAERSNSIDPEVAFLCASGAVEVVFDHDGGLLTHGWCYLSELSVRLSAAS